MHFTVRIGKRNSSVRIRNDLLALWYVLCFPEEEISYSKVQREVRRFLGKCLSKYRPDRRPSSSHIGNQGVGSAKQNHGITDFVNAYIVAEVLDKPEQKKYFKALKMLEGTMFGTATVELADLSQGEDKSAPLFLGLGAAEAM